MKGWLIYNGTNQVPKIAQLIRQLKQEADALGLELALIPSNGIFAYYDHFGKPGLAPFDTGPDCDYILFWDKDVFLAKHLEQMGYHVFNSSDAIAACDNKLLMHQLLAGSGIRVPKTILGPFVYHRQVASESQYKTMTALLGTPFILKEGKGSFGMQVYLIDSYGAYQDRLDALGDKRFILQEYIRSSVGRDIRVNLIGNRIIGAMERTNPDDFRANITLGGAGQAIELTAEQESMALNAHQLLGLDFSGVDLLYDKDGGPILCEVNSNVNFLSYEAVSGVPFGRYLLEYVIGCMQ